MSAAAPPDATAAAPPPDETTGAPQPALADLIDLACEDVGGAAILANDEFFAGKENLLRARAAEWREHEYTDKGKWMDGWETRRRRDPVGAPPGHDWCVVRLGLPGVIRAVVVDTAFFRGNFPAECSLEAAEIEGHLDLTASPEWVELLPRSRLKGDSKNEFRFTAAPPPVNADSAVESRLTASPHAERRFTHVRLRIYPDGGVARLRVLGDVAPDWARLGAHGGLVDLAALENGGRSILCSDMFFGSRNNLIAPGRPHNMSSGWETRRRRGPGHDWNIVRLGAPGTLRRIEVDTTHFKGNAPGRISIDACAAASLAPGSSAGFVDPAGDPGDWRVLLPLSPTQPHTRHVFADELRLLGRVTHLRLNVFPDGGVARLRAFGEPFHDDPRVTALARLNALPREEALAAMRSFCASLKWAERMSDARPFEDAAALLRIGDRLFWQLSDDDWLEAFAAHPRIGERMLEGATAQEQSGVAGAAASTLEQLQQANREYFERHGFVFLICATGRSASEMLEALRERLDQPRERELRTAAEEQAKILRLRIAKWLAS
jgi:allantoicase